MGISAVLILWAIFATPEGTMVAAEAPVIGYNMIWGYILLDVAIGCCLFSAIWSMVQNPKGMKVAGLSIAAIVVIVVVSAIIASGHDIQIPDVQKQTAMDTFPTMIVALNAGTIDGYVSERPGAESAVATNPDLTYVEFADGQGFETDPADTSIAVGVAKGSELTAKINEALATISDEERLQIMEDVLADQPSAE